jgi:hypothetical protein
MLEAFPPIRALVDFTEANKEFLGANSWLNGLARRSNWLYGQAHTYGHPWRIGWGTGPAQWWEARTMWRAEHPTLSFGAHINMTGGSQTAALQYYDSVNGWSYMKSGANDATDTTTGSRYFRNGCPLDFTLPAGYTIPSDGILHLRFTVTTGPFIVYRAVMQGSVGLTAWDAPPTYTDAVTSAADLNKLRTCQQRLFEVAQNSNGGSAIGAYNHSQDNTALTVARWSFIKSGIDRVYLRSTVDYASAGDYVRLYIDDPFYPDAGNRLNGGNAIISITAAETEGAHTADISGLGLTLGETYQLELVTHKGAVNPTVTVLRLTLADLASPPARTNTPGTWVEGGHVTAAQLNVIGADLVAMRDDTTLGASPILSWHPVTSHRSDALISTVTIANPRWWFLHRWRYLRWVGSGTIYSADRVYSQSLGDTTPAGSVQVMDLETVSWMSYGMEYWVEGGALTWAEEDSS